MDLGTYAKQKHYLDNAFSVVREGISADVGDWSYNQCNVEFICNGWYGEFCGRGVKPVQRSV